MVAKTNVIEPLLLYMVEARTRSLPVEVAQKAKHHILDGIASMVSGSALEPGRLATGYVRDIGGLPEATVISSNIRTSVVNAALANGMLAHADETDDSHGPSGTHPCCVVLPAALSVAERQHASGLELLRAFVLGYDVGCRVMRVLGQPGNQNRKFSEKGTGGPFSASAAASALLDFTPLQIRYMFGYAAQQSSGIRSYMMDESHVEKAFAFGGMPAQNGVAAAMMVNAGLTGEWDVFQGPYHNFFECFSPDPQPEELISELGERYEVMLTHIKKWCVGSPIQAPADALLAIIQQHDVKAKDVGRITVSMQVGSLATVNDRNMPDVNLQYIMAAMLIDSTLTFAAAHDYERMSDPDVVALKSKITVQPDSTLMSGRQAVVEVTMADGSVHRHHARSVRGAPENPMTTDEVERKAMDLMEGELGRERAEKVIETVRNLDTLTDVTGLTDLLRKDE
jgi:2-methylcitrate dehydratase PrpD